MDEQLYREIILEHWKNPQNAGVLDNPDIDLEEHNPLCGDKIRLTALINRGLTSISSQGETLSKIRFTGEGCAISQASASILSTLVQNLRVEDIRALSQQAYLDELGITLTPARLKCALLPYSTLQKALTAD